jgi:hypothetical protein
MHDFICEVFFYIYLSYAYSQHFGHYSIIILI